MHYNHNQKLPLRPITMVAASFFLFWVLLLSLLLLIFVLCCSFSVGLSAWMYISVFIAPSLILFTQK